MIGTDISITFLLPGGPTFLVTNEVMLVDLVFTQSFKTE